VTEGTSLDEAIDAAMAWITRAGWALTTFFDDRRAGFVRDSVSQDDDGQTSIGRTSTCRALTALIDLVRVLDEEGSDPQLSTWALNIIKQLAERYFNRLPEQPRELRDSRANGINMFTDSHIVLSTLLLDAFQAAGTDRSSEVERIDLPAERLAAMITAARRIVEGIEDPRDMADEGLESHLRKWGGGRTILADRNHDFITLYAMQAVDALRWRTARTVPSWPSSLSERVGNDVLQQLGSHSAGIASRFDPAQLVFGACLLRRLSVPHTPQLTRRVLSVVADLQTDDGAWTTSRSISYGRLQVLHVASVEIALALSNLLLDQLEHSPTVVHERLMPMLDRAFGLVRNTLTNAGPWQGWGNDRTRSSLFVESWTTAVVLSFLVRYRQALLTIRQHKILSKYEVIPAVHGRERLPWVHLRPVLDRFQAQELGGFAGLADPTAEGELVRAVERRLIKPVRRTWINRPSSAAVLLLGPPDTRKVPLVEAIARELDWPLLTLSPPDFFNPAGLAGFEGTAAQILQDLMRLRRVVVLLHECDDFFRSRFRAHETSIALQTIGVFITAGMLPRLRAVRNNRWVIMVVATNCERDELDPAALQHGIFDYQRYIGPPVLTAQIRYVHSHLEEESEGARTLVEALTRLDQLQRPSADREERESKITVSFDLLDDLIAGLRMRHLPLDARVLEQELVNLTERLGPALLDGRDDE
jgi:hypothetical protein